LRRKTSGGFEDNIIHAEPAVMGLWRWSPEAFYSEIGSKQPVWLGVPLIVRTSALGSLALQSYRDKHAYEQESKFTFVASQPRRPRTETRRTGAARVRGKIPALFEVHPGVMLHDEHQYLHVNSATPRISAPRTPSNGGAPSARHLVPSQPGGITARSRQCIRSA
jgi:hypothetical protein